MSKTYVEKKNGYFIEGTRISLDSVVYAFWRGETAESIAQAFPLLSLEQVYGSLTYYLAHQAEVDRYLEKAQGDYEAMRKDAQAQDPGFYQQLLSKRKEAA